MKIVFECEDGYKPEMPLEKFLSVNSYLAISDADAPVGKVWEQVMKNSNEMFVAPFLLFYENTVSPSQKSSKRPYDLVKIIYSPFLLVNCPFPLVRKQLLATIYSTKLAKPATPQTALVV